MAVMLVVMAVTAALALGSLAFMRTRDGSLKLHGLIFFLFFSTGTASALYLALLRVEV